MYLTGLTEIEYPTIINAIVNRTFTFKIACVSVLNISSTKTLPSVPCGFYKASSGKDRPYYMEKIAERPLETTEILTNNGTVFQ